MRLSTIFDPEDEGSFLLEYIFKRDKILIDNIVFYFHYHVSAVLFFVGCFIVTVGTYIMDPIECISDKAVDEVIDNYCLYHSTHTISWLGEDGETLVAHPGISSGSTVQDVKFHQYYLWVAFVLAIQAISFYIPRGIWKAWEGRRVEMMHEKIKINSNTNVLDKQKDLERLVKYLGSGNHNSYYYKLLLCETLNLVHVIVQLFITDAFLGFGLSKLNLDFLQLLKESRPLERTDTVDQMFPKVTKCTFYNYGPSGNVQSFDSLCILPVNAVNEKIFITICLWLLLLASISAFAIVYRILFLIPFVRIAVLKVHLQPVNDLNELCKKLPFGNWQLLCQLSGNNDIDSWELTKIVELLRLHAAQVS